MWTRSYARFSTSPEQGAEITAWLRTLSINDGDVYGVAVDDEQRRVGVYGFLRDLSGQYYECMMSDGWFELARGVIRIVTLKELPPCLQAGGLIFADKEAHRA